MRLDTLEVRVSLQKLLLGLIIVIVPLSLVGLYITSESVSSQEEANGAHLRAVAQATSDAVAQYIDNFVTEVGSLALAPAVLDAVSGADRSYQNLSDTAIRDRIDTQESKWGKAAGNSMLNVSSSRQFASVSRGGSENYEDLDHRQNWCNCRCHR